MFFEAIWLVFLISFGLQLFYYLYFFRRLSFFKVRSPVSQDQRSVSVVVCAHNEEQELPNLLAALCQQNVETFELVLVDDASTDGTAELMRAFQKQVSEGSIVSHEPVASRANYQNNPGTHTGPEIQVKLILMDQKEGLGKKAALAKGIQKASGEIILLTDADCVPQSPDWIRLMRNCYGQETEIVLGYGAYQKKVGLLNRLIRFETLLTAVQYFSYALANKPYMGVGRNLSYLKSTFERTDGFQRHRAHPSGDDDLFVQQAARKGKLEVCLTPSSFTLSKPAVNFGQWIGQKRRHVSTAHLYSKRFQIWLGLFYLSQLSFYAFGIAGLFSETHRNSILLLLVIRFVIQALILGKSAVKLKEKDLIWALPFYEISVIFMQLYLFWIDLVSPKKNW